jgi:hypothetical protein
MISPVRLRANASGFTRISDRCIGGLLAWAEGLALEKA